MAGLATRPFFTDNPGSLPYTYVVPGSVELEVQSIVARFDGAGAGGAFLPCLSVYSQDGHLLARVRPDQNFAIGDTGVVTWGPFLRRQVTATPSSGVTVPYFRRENFTGQTIGSGAWTQVIFSTGTDTDHSNGRIDAAGVDPDDTQILQAGRYATRGEIKWSPVFAGNTWLRIAGGLFTYYKAVMYAEPGGAAGSDESTLLVYMEYDYPGGTTTLDLHCRQDSGANQHLDAALMETAYVGDYVGQPADPDTF